MGSTPISATVTVADLVMHRIVVPDYAGPNPVSHLNTRLRTAVYKFIGLPSNLFWIWLLIIMPRIEPSILGRPQVVRDWTLTPGYAGSNPAAPVSSLVGNQWTIEKGIIDESKDVAWIKQRYHLKSILQDFGYMTTLTEIIPYADIA